MSTSDDEKCINKSKTKILNRKYTREMLKFCTKKKKIGTIKYFKEKLEREERELQVLEYNLKEELERKERELQVLEYYLKEKLERGKRKLQVLGYNLKEKLEREERELQVLEYNLKEKYYG